MFSSGLPPPPQYSDDEECTDSISTVQQSHFLSEHIPIEIDEKCAKREGNRKLAINELIDTETTYIFKLTELINIYQIPLMNNTKILKSKYHSIIFPQILQTILTLNKKLLLSLKSDNQYIGQSMIDFIPYLKMYQNYMKNHEMATKLLIKLKEDENSPFVKFLNKMSIKQNGHTLESYLILPIQRLPRYELCLQQIIKLTASNHIDLYNLNRCYQSISNVNKYINYKITEHSLRWKVHEIETRIINKNGIDIKIAAPFRIFIKEGYITKVSRKKHIKYWFILFNDILIYCSEITNNKLKLHQVINIKDRYCRVQRVCVLDEKRKYGHNNCFELHSLEKSFLCYTDNYKQREEWIDTIDQQIQKNKESQRNRLSISHRVGFNGKEGRILETAPLWIPNDFTNECMMKECYNKFSPLLFKKRNHCRYCGKLVCSECCNNTLPHFDAQQRIKGILVKVCNECYEKYEVPQLMNIEQMDNVLRNIHDIKDNDDERNHDTKDNDDILLDKYLLFDDNNININGNMAEILDKNHKIMGDLKDFGFTELNILNAWNLMKENEKHKEIVPDHGPLFIEVILNYLNKVQKNESKREILSKFKMYSLEENKNKNKKKNDELFADLNALF